MIAFDRVVIGGLGGVVIGGAAADPVFDLSVLVHELGKSIVVFTEKSPRNDMSPRS